MLIVGAGPAGRGRGAADAADDVGDHPDLPGRQARSGDGAVGCDRRCRHPGRPDPGRHPGRRASAGSGSSSSTSRSASIGFVLAVRWVPTLETRMHKFDWLGVALSGIGMFLLVFGIQQGHKYHWNAWVMTSIIGGLVVFAIFVLWQRVNKRSRWCPLSLFRDRNFSISNFAISTMSFTATAMGFPTMLYAQLVRGYSPLQSAAAVRADGRDVDHPGADRRPVHRPGAPAHPHRVGLRDHRARDLPALAHPHRRRPGLADPRRPSPCSASAWPGSGPRSPPPPPATCRCSMAGAGSGRLQRHAPGRCRARLRRDRRTARQPDRRPRAVRRRGARGCPAAAARRSCARRSARRCPTPCCCPVGVLLLGLRVRALLRAPASPDGQRAQPAAAPQRSRRAATAGLD